MFPPIPRLALLPAVFFSLAGGLFAQEKPVESWTFEKAGETIQGTKGTELKPIGSVVASEGCLDTTGGGAYIGSEPLSRLTGDIFSIVAQVRMDHKSTGYGTIFFSTPGTIRISGNDLRAACDGEWQAISSPQVSTMTGSWRQVALTMDGTTYRLYLDGIVVGERPASSEMRKDGYISIGGREPMNAPENPSSYESFPGLIKEVQIFDSALTPEQLKALP